MEPTREQLAELARQLAETRPEELDCEAVLDRVAGYLEQMGGGTAMPPELETVRQHLTICPACAEEFDALVRAVE